MKKLLSFTLLLLFAPSVLANHNTFDSRVNLNQISWFDRGLYFGALPYQPCLDLDEFYAYADSDKYDRWDRDDAEQYVKRLDYFDTERLANKKRSDYLDADDYTKPKDLTCSTKRAFDVIANKDRFDGRDDDDFYEFIGTKNANQYQNQARHFPYEREYSSAYMRVDKYGGIVSKYRLQ